MPTSEQKLIDWTKPSSDHEEAMCDRSARMIADSLKKHPQLSRRSYIVIPQGSYHNNTNVRLSSDVDICVVFTDVASNSFDYAQGWSWQRLGMSSSSEVFSNDRETIGSALINTFGSSGVKPGGKAYQVLGNIGTRVVADVVPAWRFNGWVGNSTIYTPEKREGVTFWTREGNQVINFPEQHHTNGKAKNTRTGYAYKKATRILKRIRYDMLDQNNPIADGLSSFTIESAMYNVPDNLFSDRTWNGAMENILYFMDDELYQGRAEENWIEVSGMKWMFKKNYGLPSNWNPNNLRNFVRAARKLIE